MKKNRLKALRELLHLTQAEMAEKMHVTQAAISKIEAGINPLQGTLLFAVELLEGRHRIDKMNKRRLRHVQNG